MNENTNEMVTLAGEATEATTELAKAIDVSKGGEVLTTLGKGMAFLVGGYVLGNYVVKPAVKVTVKGVKALIGKVKSKNEAKDDVVDAEDFREEDCFEEDVEETN